VKKKEELMEETQDTAQLYPVNWAGRRDGRRVGPGMETPSGSEPRSGMEPPLVERKGPEADDLKLLRRAGAKDARAFRDLVDRHADRLFRLAFSLVGNAADAEDVVQETFAGAFRGIDGFEGRSSVGPWLTRILVTQAAKLRRDRKRPTPQPLETIEGRGSELRASSQGGVASAERRMDLHAALALLSPEHRQILVLREFEQLSYEEMAEILGVPRGTVESRLHRARGELREKLKAYLPS
jgi:RNA polymerase sigma-70 factor (ECF subfamily)